MVLESEYLKLKPHKGQTNTSFIFRNFRITVSI